VDYTEEEKQNAIELLVQSLMQVGHVDEENARDLATKMVAHAAAGEPGVPQFPRPQPEADA
jgi:hypothetical protein